MKGLALKLFQERGAVLPVQLERSALQAGHYRRFHGYDYARGASLFVTFAVKGRARVFGRVEGEKVAYSPAGLAALETIERENQRGGFVLAVKCEVMPDHLHLRLVLKPGADEPLKAVGQFVNNVKRWSRVKAAKLGVDFEWESNYHDRICCSRFINEKVDAYIGYNALKWSLMHGDNALLRVQEPLKFDRFPDDEWWCGVGNLELLADERKIVAVSLSRSIPKSDEPVVVERLLKAARGGWVIASTFISPCERALAAALEREKLAMVRAVPDPLKMVYRPKVEETPAFAEGRLALISRECSSEVSRYDAWHGINDALYEIAAASGGGCGAYVHKKGVAKVTWVRKPVARPPTAATSPASTAATSPASTRLRGPSDREENLLKLRAMRGCISRCR